MNLSEQFDQLRELHRSLGQQIETLYGQVERSSESVAAQPNEQMPLALAAYLSLQPALNEDQLLNNLLQLTMRTTQAEGAGITLYDQDRERLVFVAAVGKGSENLIGNEIPLEGSVSGLAFATGEIQVALPQYVKIEEDIGVDFRNLIVAPLLVDDQPIGTLGAVDKQVEEMFTHADIETFGLFAQLAAVIVRQHRREHQLLRWIEGASDLSVQEMPQQVLTAQERRSLLLTLELGQILRARPDLLPNIEQYLSGLSVSVHRRSW